MMAMAMATDGTFSRVPFAVVTDAGLTDADLRVLLVIQALSRSNAGCSEPVETIAKRAGKDVRSIQRSIRRMLMSGKYLQSIPDSTRRTGRRLVVVWPGVTDLSPEGDSVATSSGLAGPTGDGIVAREVTVLPPTSVNPDNWAIAGTRLEQVEVLVRWLFAACPRELRPAFAHDLAALAGELLGECPDVPDDVDEGEGEEHEVRPMADGQETMDQRRVRFALEKAAQLKAEREEAEQRRTAALHKPVADQVAVATARAKANVTNPPD